MPRFFRHCGMIESVRASGTQADRHVGTTRRQNASIPTTSTSVVSDNSGTSPQRFARGGSDPVQRPQIRISPMARVRDPVAISAARDERFEEQISKSPNVLE